MVHHKYTTRASNLAYVCYSKREGSWANFLLLYNYVPLEQPAYRIKTM